MTRPLYKTAVCQPTKRGQDGHAGLWFDKFCNRWRNDKCWTLSNEKNDKERNPKLDWINDITDIPIGNSNEIEEYALRLMRLVERCSGHVEIFTAESRFVTGLGRSHPIENGFAWHPTLGTPYIPGSSVKGLVRAWVEAEVDPSLDTDTRNRLFGNQGNAGHICFMEAVPVEAVRLEADVMTPHYAGWSATEPPGDWMPPTPIPFLTVAEKTSFLFALLPNRTASSGDLVIVADRLSEALAWAGSGAKTAVGYGRFRRDDEKTRRWTERVKEEHRRQDELKSPTGRWRLEIEGKTETEVLEKVRIHLQKERLEDSAERRAFAETVLAARSEWVTRWRRGEKHDRQTNVGSKKLKGSVRLLEEAAAEGSLDS